jgi:hypothetical protein
LLPRPVWSAARKRLMLMASEGKIKKTRDRDWPDN